MSRRLLILDPDLKGIAGHNLDYDRVVAAAAAERGIAVEIVASAAFPADGGGDTPIRPLYSLDIWGRRPDEAYRSRPDWSATNRAFETETARLLAERHWGPDDIAFIPNITRLQLLGAARVALGRRQARPRLAVRLGYETSYYRGFAAMLAFRGLEAAAWRRRALLATDSARLRADLRQLTAAPIDYIPVPLARPHPIRPGRTVPPYHVVALGNARREKGFHRVLAALQGVAGTSWGHLVRVTLQCSDAAPDMAAALAAARAGLPAGSVLLPDALDADAYGALLADADIVLLPYDGVVYRARTSGVFTEAVAAGKVVICTDDTWMSDLARAAGVGVLLPDPSPAALVAAIGTAVRSYDSLAAAAVRAAPRFRAEHAASRLIDWLFGPSG